MVALAILAVVLAIAATTLRGPGAQLIAERRAAEFMREAAAVRQAAVLTGEVHTLAGAGCDGDGEITLRFFPDGTALGEDVCFHEKEQSVRLSLNPLSGQLTPRSES